MFSRAISSDDVAAIYNAGAAGKCKSPASIIQMIIERTNLLVTAGVLNRGQGTSLIAKLDAALNQIDQDHSETAVNQLEAFVSEVNALVNAGVLSAGQAQQLINLAEHAMNRLAEQP